MSQTSAMTPPEIMERVLRLDTTSWTEQDEVWSALRPLGENVVRFLADAYPRFSRGQGRAALVHHALPYARTNEHAFRLGIAALNDRASMVRYHACALLAYSLRRDALPSLEEARRRGDSKLAEDAAAATTAIKHQDHHLFKDRGRTGRVDWVVNEEDRRC